MKEEQKQEIIWNLVNAGLAGLLVLLGSFTSGELTAQGLIAAISASLLVVVTKFRNYWVSTNKSGGKAFSFI